MKNIGLLVRKDLWQQRRFVFALLALELAGGAALFVQLRGKGAVPATVTLAVLMLLGYVGPFMFCYRTMLAEEKNRTFLLLKTLPLDNRQLVLAKFGANFLLCSANLLVMVLYYVVVGHFLFAPSAVVHISFSLFYFTLVTVLGMSAFFVAISLVFESEKVAWFLLPLLWVVANIVANWHVLVRVLGIEQLVAYLGTHFNVVSTALMVGVALIVYATEILFDRRKSFG